LILWSLGLFITGLKLWHGAPACLKMPLFFRKDPFFFFEAANCLEFTCTILLCVILFTFSKLSYSSPWSCQAIWHVLCSQGSFFFGSAAGKLLSFFHYLPSRFNRETIL
jgi:hypothetical protein